MFLDLANLEPHQDQWAYLSTLGRTTPREVVRAADRAGQVTVGIAVDRIGVPGSTKTRPPAPAVIHARLGAGIRVEQAELTPALLTTFKHAAARRDDIPALTAGYGLVVADECHHVLAAAFEHAVKQIPARRWLGLTATPTAATSLMT